MNYIKKIRLPLMLSVVCALIATSQSCKKTDDAVVLPIIAAWESLTDTTFRYLVFNSDQSVSVLKEATYGVHASSHRAFTASTEQVIFGLTSNAAELFNYRISNDSLYLSNTNKYIVLKRNNTVTSTGWSKRVVITESHALGTGYRFGPLEWDGTNFLISGVYNNHLYRINPSGFSVVDSSAVSQDASGIAVVGAGNIWVNNDGADKKLRQIDYVTGMTTGISGDCTEYPKILATEGSNIWLFTDNSDLYLYNTVANTFTLKQSMPGFVGSGGSLTPDMVVKDGAAYIAGGNAILKLDLTTYQVTDTYILESNSLVIGIAHNGTDFYVLTIVMGISLAELNPTIHKVQL